MTAANDAEAHGADRDPTSFDFERSNPLFQLGERVEDIYTGASAIVIGRTEYLHESTNYLVVPDALPATEMHKPVWIFGTALRRLA